jgi:cysteinyl-tRNA synthetase
MANIRVYNTLTGKKDALKPLKGKKINLFVCGPTVYDFLHIGNGRTAVFFDCFVKYLKHEGFTVFYLQNITNIDDKIILRAREKGVLPMDLATAFEKEYLKDMKALGVDSVNKYARATNYIKEIINQISRLMEKGYAYRLDDGIYFDISKFKDYGKLSGRTVLQAEDSTSRVDYATNKKNRGDFALWKLNDNRNEPSWPSPFGAGRPGWHIEDTAITENFFGAQYDIHGGGIDLIFPHHEAEVTQMEALSGKHPLAQYWMHVGFLTMNGQKMSKSVGNTIIIKDFLKRNPPEQLRFLLMRNLWHAPLDYSDATMFEVKSALDRIKDFLLKIKAYKPKNKISKNFASKKFTEEFWGSLADDFNTPKAFAAIFELITATHSAMNEDRLGKKDISEILKFFNAMNAIFGIVDFEKIKQHKIPAPVLTLMKAREDLRKNSEWQKADAVRLEIEKYGYTIEDTVSGSIVKKN